MKFLSKRTAAIPNAAADADNDAISGSTVVPPGDVSLVAVTAPSIKEALKGIRLSYATAEDAGGRSIDFLGDEDNGTSEMYGDGSPLSSQYMIASAFPDPHYAVERAKRFHSGYVGGFEGVCATCEALKASCSCQRCHCCDSFLLSLTTRRHCRQCWRPTCPKCSDYRRINDFVDGEASRTCSSCAVPRALLFVTQLRYSLYENVCVLDRPAKDSQHNEEAEATAATLKSQPPFLGPRSFYWGLYALGCVMEAPRRCIDCCCADPLSYADVCEACQLPTVTQAMHQVRHITVGSNGERVKARKGADSRKKLSAEALENAVSSAYDAIAEARTDTEVEDIFSASLPSKVAKDLFTKLANDSWAPRKVLLSLVACSIAGESSALPSISLAMTDVPLYARLLQPLHVTEAFTVFKSPGRLRLVAFNSGAGVGSLVQQVLSGRMAYRELWSSEALTAQQVLGKVVENKAAAEMAGLTTNIASWSMREGLLQYIAESSVLLSATEVILRMARDGEDVLLCGHGIGGAAASWLMTCLLLEHPPAIRERLFCMTFGAPLIASRSFTGVLASHGMTHQFHHFIYGSDMVPRLGYMESLLASGNAASCASFTGYPRTSVSAAKVRERVVRWIAAHEEPCHEQDTQLRQHPSGSSEKTSTLFGLVRKVRGRSKSAVAQSTSSWKRHDSGVAMAVDGYGCGDDETPSDLFQASREPFDNNAVRVVAYQGDPDDKTGSTTDISPIDTWRDADFARFSTPQHRDKQSMDPFGCYHFIWHPRGRYIFAEEPATVIALLSDRTAMRIDLQQHLLSSYHRGMTEYIHSSAAEQA